MEIKRKPENKKGWEEVTKKGKEKIRKEEGV